MIFYADSYIEFPLKIAYNVIQLLCFTLMAVFIMRLKLFATPQLCVVASLIANEKVVKLFTSLQLLKSCKFSEGLAESGGEAIIQASPRRRHSYHSGNGL